MTITFYNLILEKNAYNFGDQPKKLNICTSKLSENMQIIFFDYHLLGGDLLQFCAKFTLIFERNNGRHEMNQSSTIIHYLITFSFQY